MRISHLRVVVTALLLGTTLTFPDHVYPQCGVGALDHVRILVRDINATRSLYLNQLGFASGLQQPLAYAEGSAHDGALLSENQVLEWIGVVDREKLLGARPWIVNFIDKYEGAHSVGLKISSATETAARLQTAGVNFSLFTLVRKEGQEPVMLVTPKMPHLPEGSVFFVQYPPRKTPPTKVVQPNTADRIAAVWIVVNDVKAAGADLQALGFSRVRHVKSKVLGAEGDEFAAERGKIVLVHTAGSGGPAQQFTTRRAEGLMAVTVLVANLEQAHSLVESNTGRSISIYKGTHGKSFLVPAHIASGVWIEMAAQK